MAATYQFKAFISYKHVTSTGFAEQLEAALKGYAKPLLTWPIKIFRDEKHLVPGIDLPKLIKEALDASEFLVLLASPNAAESVWVHDELDHWCRALARSEYLIVVLLDGQIAVDENTKRIDWDRTDALPPILREYLQHVQFYVDLRRIAQSHDLTLADAGFKRAVNGISARFRNVDPNQMLGEENLQQRRNLRLRNGAVAVLSATTLLSMSLAIVAYVARQQAVKDRIQAERNLHTATIATSEALLQKQPDLAVLLAIEAEKMRDTPRARGQLLAALEQAPTMIAFLHGHTAEVVGLAFSSDGSTLASASRDQSIRLWDVTTRQPLGPPLTGHTGWVFGVAFSQDGAALASASWDQSVRLWDVTTRQPLGRPLTGHTAVVVSVAVSPDGATLASASWDQSIRLWDVATRQPLGPPLTGHTEGVSSVAFSPDGAALASASWDKSIRLWDLKMTSWITRACGIANRNLTDEEWKKFFGDQPYRQTCPNLPIPTDSAQQSDKVSS